MKKLILSLLIAFFMLPIFATTVAQDAKIYAEPSTDSETIILLKQGKAIKNYGYCKNPNMYKVKVEKDYTYVNGYIDKSLVVEEIVSEFNECWVLLLFACLIFVLMFPKFNAIFSLFVNFVFFIIVIKGFFFYNPSYISNSAFNIFFNILALIGKSAFENTLHTTDDYEISHEGNGKFSLHKKVEGHGPIGTFFSCLFEAGILSVILYWILKKICNLVILSNIILLCLVLGCIYFSYLRFEDAFPKKKKAK